jgi:hypothetical protein
VVIFTLECVDHENIDLGSFYYQMLRTRAVIGML